MKALRSVGSLLIALTLVGCGSGELTQSPGTEEAGLKALPGVRNDALRQAAEKYNLPPDLLAALAYQQSRFEAPTFHARDAAAQNPAPASPVPEEMSQEPVEEERYGVMVLSADQVTLGARLTGRAEEEIRQDVGANFEAAAAILHQLAGTSTASGVSDEALTEAVARFVGLEPGSEAALLNHEELTKLLQRGFDVTTADDERVLLIGRGGQTGEAEAALTAGQYPPLHWISSPNFSSRDGLKVIFVVVHDMEGTQATAINVFQSTARQASAHYLLRASDGNVVQMVHESDNAWHCGNKPYNQRSIGIEHEGFADYPGGRGYYTATQYRVSAQLVCAIAKKYSIPIDRSHIVGHGNVPPSGYTGRFCTDTQANSGQCGGSSHHHDPGKYWDWTGYLNQIATCVRGGVSTGKLTGAVFHGGSMANRVAGAIVSVPGKTVTSGADGMFALDVAPGTYTLTVSKAGYSTAHTVRAVIAGATVWASTEINPVIAKGTVRGEVYLYNAAKPTDTTKPVSGATVKVGGLSLTTGADGIFQASLAPGTYTVVASKTGYTTKSRSVAVVASAVVSGSIALPAPGTPDVTPPVVAISFPLDQASVDLAEVTLTGSASDNAGALSKVSLVLNAGAAISVPVAAGAYSHPVKLRPGLNTLVVTATDVAGKTSTDTARVTFNAGVGGRVQDSDDNTLAVPTATLQVTDPVSGAVITTGASDANGVYAFNLTKVPATYLLIAKAPGYRTRTETVIVPDDARVVLNLSLIRGDDSQAQGGAIVFDNLEDGAVVTSQSLTFQGTVTGIALASIEVNGVAGEVLADGHFSGTIPLVEGANTLEAIAKSPAGVSVVSRLTVVRQSGAQAGCSSVPGGELLALLALAPLARRLRRRRA